MLFSETMHAFLLLHSCKQQVLLYQQQIVRTSDMVGSKQQLVLTFSYKQLELVNYKLKIPSSSTMMLIEQYIFLLSHIKIYSVCSVFVTPARTARISSWRGRTHSRRGWIESRRGWTSRRIGCKLAEQDGHWTAIKRVGTAITACFINSTVQYRNSCTLLHSDQESLYSTASS